MEKTNKSTKSPRLIRRGDVVQIKGTQQDEVVRGVAIVLQLANGQNETYDVGEQVVMGVDTDVTPAELVAAAEADAAERAARATADQTYEEQATPEPTPEPTPAPE